MMRNSRQYHLHQKNQHYRYCLDLHLRQHYRPFLCYRPSDQNQNYRLIRFHQNHQDYLYFLLRLDFRLSHHCR